MNEEILEILENVLAILEGIDKLKPSTQYEQACAYLDFHSLVKNHVGKDELEPMIKELKEDIAREGELCEIDFEPLTIEE